MWSVESGRNIWGAFLTSSFRNSSKLEKPIKLYSQAPESFNLHQPENIKAWRQYLLTKYNHNLVVFKQECAAAAQNHQPTFSLEAGLEKKALAYFWTTYFNR